MPSLGFGLFKSPGDREIPTPLPQRLMPPRAPQSQKPESGYPDVEGWRIRQPGTCPDIRTGVWRIRQMEGC